MRIRIFVVISIIFAFTAVAVRAQNTRLELGQPDTSDFPIVRIVVQTAGTNNAPLNDADLANLRLRENGVPISDFELQFVPVGADIIFVVDADSTLLLRDVDEMSRLEMVRESVGRYANRFMSPNGLDRVSIIVPNQSNRGAAYLVEDAIMPEAVINALAQYDPAELPEEGPVNELVIAALDKAEAIRQDGRYQAIVLLSESRRLSQFLDYPLLVETAQANDVPIFAGILGPEASLEDIGNASALADPTGGFYLHIPRAERVDPIYLRWQQESNLPQLTYQSLLNESGTYPVSVNLGQSTATTDLELTLLPPAVTIMLDKGVIQRAGTAVDTPLSELQPQVQPVPVEISWPDGLPRRLTDVSFRVNNVPQPLLELPQPDQDGRISFDWNIQTADVGVYELSVTVEDELGNQVEAEPHILTISLERPDPPTPTPAPTATPLPAEQVAELTTIPRDNLLMLLAGVALLGLVLLLIRGFRRFRRRAALSRARGEQRAELQRIQEEQVTQAALAETEEEEVLYLTLLVMDENLNLQGRLPLDLDNVTIGRQAEAAMIVLDDPSISRLHARIRQRNNDFWLYDEGSERGTYLNYERVGLSPRQLQDNDTIQFGQVTCRVQLLNYIEDVEEEPVAAEVPGEVDETGGSDEAEVPASELADEGVDDDKVVTTSEVEGEVGEPAAQEVEDDGDSEDTAADEQNTAATGS